MTLIDLSEFNVKCLHHTTHGKLGGGVGNPVGAKLST